MPRYIVYIVLVTIVQLLYNAQDWTQLNDRIQDLVKKRSQLKQAVAKMIAECCTFLDNIKDKPTMLKLIDTLRTVTAGKIYVENERARLTHRLAKIHEKDDNVAEAAKIMQELQVIHNTDVSKCHMCQLCAGGDVWLDGETGEGGVDP